MGVVVEALHEPLAHVLVDERVVRDVVDPAVHLLLVRELAEEQEVGNLEEGRVLGELLDRIAAVTEDAVGAVEVGDVGRRRGRATEAGIEHPGSGHQLLDGGHVDAAVLDGNLDALASAVVGDRYGLGHGVKLLVGRQFGADATRHCVDTGPMTRGRSAVPKSSRKWPAEVTCGATLGCIRADRGQRGELSCFRGRSRSRLVERASKAAARVERVSAGSITCEIEPRSAVGYGVRYRAS